MEAMELSSKMDAEVCCVQCGVVWVMYGRREGGEGMGGGNSIKGVLLGSGNNYVRSKLDTVGTVECRNG